LNTPGYLTTPSSHHTHQGATHESVTHQGVVANGTATNGASSHVVAVSRPARIGPANLPIRVLLIDDNRDDYLITSDFFEDCNDLTLRLDWVDNYEDGLAAVLSGQYDVCLLDHLLGAQSGLDLLHEVGAAGCTVPIIMLTGLSDREVDLEAMRAGAVDYLVKDQLSAPLLERSIRYAMERKRSEEKLQQSQQFLQLTLDALAANIAVLDDRGIVIAVNEAWRNFAHQGDFKDSSYGIGSNYLDICNAAPEVAESVAVAEGIRQVLRGECQEFQLEYPCVTPQSHLWFNVRVTRFQSRDSVCVVVAHENITDRKTAEEHRRQSEMHLSTLIKGTPFVVWIVDTNRVFSFSNGRVLGEPGLQPGEVVGKSLEQIYGNVPEIIRAHERAFAGEEVSLETKLGDMAFEARYSPVRDARGDITGVFGVALNISERKAAEEALRQSETRFRTVVQNLGEGLLITDLNDTVLYANARMSELSGYSHEELLGRPAYELLLSREDWPDLLQRNQQRASGQAECYEVLMHRKDGNTFWAEVNATPYLDAEGNICGTLGAITDVTKRKQALAALAESQYRLQALFNNAQDAILLMDDAGRYMEANPAACELLGYTREEILTKTVREITAAGQNEPADHLLRDFIGHGHQSGEYVLNNKDGTLAVVEYRAVANIVPGVHLSVMRDVSDRKRAEQQRQATTQGLFAVLSAADQLLSCPDVDTLARHAVELARERLGIERCAIFLLDDNECMNGTYGTNIQGQTTNEHHVRLGKAHWRQRRLQMEQQPEARWLVREQASLWEQRGQNGVEIGVGWSATTLIYSLHGPVGMFSNDTARTHAPVDEVKQELIAVYCSLLGNIIERKRTEERQRATSEGLKAVMTAADELLNCPDLDTLLRRAVELARERLGLERCGICLVDAARGEMRGTYGTDLQRRTTDEHTSLKKISWVQDYENNETGRPRWLIFEDQPMCEWTGNDYVSLDTRGWVVGTPVVSSTGVMGVLYNDTAISGAPIDVTQQEVLAVFSSLLGNIIERKRAEQTLAEERNTLRTLIDSLPDHIYIKDLEGRFTLYNESVVRHFALPSPGWLLGKSDHDLFPEDASILHRENQMQLMRTGQPILDWEYLGHGPGGKPEWFLISQMPLRDSQGNIVGIVGTNRYITATKQAEERQRAMGKGLRAVLDVADELLGTSSLDALLMRTVELARERLGIERCAIFLVDNENNIMAGTYGTDAQGRTSDEHSHGFPLEGVRETFFDFSSREQRRWNVIENVALTQWDGTDNVECATGWSAMTPIFSSHGPVRVPVGVLVNDAAISGAPFDEVRQEMAAVLCSLLGNMIERHRAAEALRESEEKYRTIVDTAYEGIWLLDRYSQTSYVNRQMAQMLGYTPEEMSGRSIYDFADKDAGEELRERFERERSTGSAQIEFCFRRKDGSELWTFISCNVMRNPEGEFAGVLGMVTDITERKVAEQALRESEERYALAASGANDGLWDWDMRTEKIYFSRRWKSMLGYSDAQIGDSPNEWLSRIHPDDAAKVHSDLQDHLAGRTSHFENEHRMSHENGTYRYMLTRGLAVRDANGASYRMAGSQTDITERKVAEQQLLHDAIHDSLTGLPNRALFKEVLRNALERLKRRTEYSFAVLFLDLDHFKVINDSLGHVVGDQLICTIARRLESCLRPGDTVARLGGDEFTILLDGIENADTATAIADRIQQEMAEPIDLDGHQRFTTTSIGIALSTTGYERPDDILRDADTAMYRAKSGGRDRYEVFDKTMHVQAVTRLELESSLRSALETQLMLHYQPIVLLRTGRIVGFEALVRWRHPERGMVPPAEFIPLAEETGLILPISQWVLREACRQMQQWQEHSPQFAGLTVSVNLSSKQFSQPGLDTQVAQILQETGLQPQMLKLEITESVIMQNAATVTATLNHLRALNVQLYMDDFGTGYSSLSYLHNFPIDVLKIDRSFINRIGPEGQHSEIVRTILGLARSLNLEVVAEGIETAEQMKQLQLMGCHYGQGYLFSKPVDGQSIAALIEQWPQWC
jgi:diguanylate cyclase (GGDEF)-like protein/PAS domain S-box-containing protein